MKALLSSVAALALMALPAFFVPFAEAGEAFTMEEYFNGQTVAKGVFVSKIAKTRREFDVRITGTFDGAVLTLREDFVFADGEIDQKTWVFKKSDGNTYVGTREDLVGTTLLTFKDNVAHFEYDVLLPRAGKKPVKVHFDDKMILRKDGILLNRARVSKFGLPIGKVAVNFARGTDFDAVEMPKL